MRRALVVSPLLLLLLLLSLPLPGAGARAFEDLAPVMPADAALYVRARSVDALLSELAAAKFLRDGGTLRALYEEQIGGLISHLSENTGVTAEAWLSILHSIQGIHIALMNVGKGPADLDLLVAVEVGKPDEVRKALLKLEERAGEKIVFAGEVAGARVMAAEADDDATVLYALHEGVVFVATRPERISAALEGRKKPPERSLANQPLYRAGALPVGEGTSLFAFADVQKAIGVLLSALDGREVRELNEIVGILRLEQVHTASLVASGGHTHARVTFDADHPWLAAARGEPGSGRLQAFVPADSVFCGIDSGPIDKKWAALSRLLADEKTFPEADEFKKFLGEAAEMFGFTLDELAAALGKEWMVCMPLVDEGTRVDDDAILFAADIEDREKFDALLERFRGGKLVKRMEERGRGLVAEPYAGYEILREGRGEVSGVFCTAVVEDTLLLSGDVRGMKAALDAKTKGPTFAARSGPYLGGLPRTGTKHVVLDLRWLLTTEREFTPLLDFVAEGAVLAATADEAPGRIDVRANVSPAELVGLLFAGEMFGDRYRREQGACLENLTAIGVAIAKYREEKGESPPSLAALAGKYLPKARLVCPLDAGDEEVTCSYEDALQAGDPGEWGFDAWCPHRLHGRLVLYRNGNAYAGQEDSFLRQLYRQGIRRR